MRVPELMGDLFQWVKTYISKLKQVGLLVRVGSNKTGYWIVMIAR